MTAMSDGLIIIEVDIHMHTFFGTQRALLAVC